MGVVRSGHGHPRELAEGGTTRVCAPGEIRTPNLLIRSQMLYPLSYGRLRALYGERKRKV